MLKNSRLGLVFFLGLECCTHHVKPFVPERPNNAIDPSVLLHIFQTRRSLFQNPIGVDASINIEHQGKTESMKAELLMARPRWLYLEGTVSILLGASLYLAFTPHTFQAYNVHDNRFYYGPSNACSLSKVVPLFPTEIDLHEMMEVFFGSAPQLTDANIESIEWDGSDGGKDVIVLKDSQGNREKLWLSLSPSPGNLVRAEIYLKNQDKPRWMITHEEYEAREGFSIPMPRHTTFIDRLRDQKVTIRWKNWNASVGTENQLWQTKFRLTSVPDSTMEQTNCI